MKLPRALQVWPVPAVLAWLGAWATLQAVLAAQQGPVAALAAGCAVGLGASLWGRTWWRRLFIAAGFPLSVAFSGLFTLPGWAWLRWALFCSA